MGKVLSIFVDESGRFQFPDANSRFYILGLVLHDQSQPVDCYVADLQMFVSEIIDYIRANGEITFGILQTETPFSDFELDALFKDKMGEWQKLVSRLNDILPIAV